MHAQATKLEGAENDLKQLMADVARAMEKAQEAGGPRETDCVPGHIGLEPANPCAIYLIGFT
jgi:hypothetical protein